MIQTIVRQNNYMDSIFLMTASREMMGIPGVRDAVVVMGSDMNKTVLEEFGGLTPEAAAATPNDLILSLDLAEEGLMTRVQQRLEALLSGGASGQTEAAPEFPALSLAADSLPGANLAIISVPGEFALREGLLALGRGINPFIFSDMSEKEELELKELAGEKNLLVMGPGCGCAIIGGVSLGLMSKVRRGPVGIVGASGSGIHEIAMLLHRYGLGVSQAIGTGGRDLSQRVGGRTMLQGIDYLTGDPDTKVIVLVSKPPHPDTARKIYAALPKNKPVVIFFLGGDPEEIAAAGAYPAATLEDAACTAATLEDAACTAAALARGQQPHGENAVAVAKEQLSGLAQTERARLSPRQRYLRGLFCGGTHSEEAVLLLQDFVPNLHSNLSFGKVELLPDRQRSLQNALVDMGDEEFTRGRPHPVMDPSILCGRMLQEARDPEVGVILFDLLLGHGAHRDPVGAIEETLREIRQTCDKEGRYISIVASLCGTDLDPQGLAEQERRLRELGVHLLPSNAKAALLAGLIIQGGP